MYASANGTVGNSVDYSGVSAGESSEASVTGANKVVNVGASKVYGAYYVVCDSGYVWCGTVGLGSGGVVSCCDGVKVVYAAEVSESLVKVTCVVCGADWASYSDVVEADGYAYSVYYVIIPELKMGFVT